ncbi:MAG: sodium-dependent transporter [Prolixibacteraceae bacterium]|nr:sodium-dependent transporter [Prolixibacteraceae bacterium]
MKNISESRELFGSRFGIIAATAGSAVGLGNIWRFPYVAGANGGGAFLLIYVGFVLAIGIPVMLSEFVIGRAAHKNAIGSFRALAPGKPWYLVGIMGIGAAFMILAFYTAVAGWTLEYVYQSIIDGFSGKTPEQLEEMFTGFRSSSFRPLLWFFIFMILTAWIIMSGVKKGIEKSTKILMPLLVIILLILCVRSLTLPGASEGVKFLFKPDFSKITPRSVLEALGQAFFSLSIGMGTLITYASYVPKHNNLMKTSGYVAMVDTVIAILAGLAIFPAVFAFNIPPMSGEGLVFMTLPNIFGQMSGGYFFSIIFFVLLTVAALTSTISLLEVIVAFFVEELKIKRKAATWISAILVSILGIVATLSWGTLKGVKIFGKMIFDFLDYTSANILLPLGGFFIVLFVAWFFGRDKVEAELTNNGKLKSKLLLFFYFAIRFLAPLCIAFIFLNGIGLLRF